MGSYPSGDGRRFDPRYSVKADQIDRLFLFPYFSLEQLAVRIILTLIPTEISITCTLKDMYLLLAPVTRADK